MGYQDYYCPLCGLPLNANNNENKYKKWLFNYTILFKSNNIIKNTNGMCTIDGRDLYINDNFDLFNLILLHYNCWLYIKKKYKIELKYSDLPLTNTLYFDNIYKNYNFFTFSISYKPISNYWSQDFNYTDFINNGGNMISPIKKNGCNKFIDKIFKKLKIKLDRVGPRVSATFYDNNDILIGCDNNLWKKYNSKWNIINNTFIDNYIHDFTINNKNKNIFDLIYSYFNYLFIDYKKINKLPLLNIPQLGQISKIGFLIKKININKHGKQFKLTIEIIGDNEYKHIYDKMLNTNFGLDKYFK